MQNRPSADPMTARAEGAGRLAGKRLLVVEEALKDPIGHWYEYVRAVVELSRAEGAEVMSAAHARIDPAIAREISALAAFPHSNWDGVYAHPKAWRRYLGVFRHNWLVFSTMRRVVDEHGPFDCLFAPTVVVHHVWGWRLLYAFRRRHIGRMVLLFRNNAASYAPGSTVPVFKRSAIMLKLALRSFAEAIAKGRVELATDSTRLSTEYAALSGLAPVVYPSPRTAPFASEDRPAKGQDEPLVFSCLGPARFEKGIDLLQDAIKIVLGQGPTRPVKFVIQWNQPILDAAGDPYEPDPALLTDGRVEFITRPLDSAEYDAAIAATDCMLLPYRRDSYFARISGVAVEAVTAGIPMVYTNDTWTADLVEDVGAGLGTDDGDLVALAAGIGDKIAHYDRYRDEAAQRRAAAQAAHSGGAFVDRLWGLG
jgi:glycosyltransferase involved in cell wall biosynthesis